MKNLLIIGGAVIGVIIVGLVVVYFTMPGLLGLGSNNNQDNAASAPASTPLPRPSVAAHPGKPGSQAAAIGGKNSSAAKAKAQMAAKAAAAKAAAAKAAAAKAKQVAAAKAKAPGKPGAKVASLVGAPPVARPDPFVIPGVHVVAPPKPTVISFAPTPIITDWQPHAAKPPSTGPVVNAPASLPNDRVAGIMLNNGVYAIMDTGGQSQVVQPGDTLPGGERVVSIQSDSVTLRTPEDQTVNLPLSAGAGSGGGGFVPGGVPASFNPGGNGGPQYNF